MPKVSVIVPVYNVEKYIDKCLDSLANQTLEDIEILVVNDGSKDKSKQIIEKYVKDYPNKIKYLEKENGGLSDARNYGLLYATGEYIAFLDSDDYVKKNMYETMYKVAIENDYDMVECDFYWVYPDKMKEDIGEYYIGTKEALEKARVVAWNKLYKKEIIEKSGVVFPKGLRYEDVEFFYKILPSLNKIGFVKEAFIYYIQRDNSISNTQNEKTKEIFQIFENVFDFYKEKDIFDEYKQELEYTYARYILCSSFLRMIKIKDKETRKRLLKQAWDNLNTKFPEWKKNSILKRKKDLKAMYMKSVNKVTYNIYSIIFSF